MKTKVCFFVVFFLLVLQVHSQLDSARKARRHELGADITGLFTQLLKAGSEFNSVYIPTYYLSYRCHFKKSNIRLGIGGMQHSAQTTPYAINDEEKSLSNGSSALYLRIGYELTSELSRKWQAFYGLDLRPSFARTRNEVEFSNGGYYNGSIRNTDSYGIAPLLGFRYRITNRVSILTEASFIYSIETATSQRTYISMDRAKFPDLPDSKKTTIKNTSASFNQPVFLILTVDI